MKIVESKKTTKATLLSIIILTSAIFVTAAVHSGNADNKASGTATVATAATFNNYELAGNPFNTPRFSVGTTCPNASRTCQNTEGEPAIRADKSGNFYGSSENVFCVIGGQCGGTFAWKSTDGGQHFTTLPLPDSISNGTGPVGFSPAGGDTDLAVAPQKNSQGFYNIYVASLATTPPLANVYVATSRDGGATWFNNPTGATIPVDDREWIAADGTSKVCLSYHAYGTTNNIFVDCSYDGGATFTQVANAFDNAHVAIFAGYNNVIGNLAIDPSNHVIYQVFSSIANAAELAACTISCHVHTVWVGVSIDGGKTFTDYTVYNNPNTNLDYGHQFINVSVDSGGNVYAVYSDDHNLYYSFSRTFGQSWSKAYQINKAPSSTAIFPWSAAGSAGTLDVVWYGTSFYNGVDHPDTYPNSAAWQVYFSQNLAALTPNSPWTQVAASGIIHYGGVCESGVACTGNRDLLDDFGVAASPTTGLATIIYTNDQFVNSALEPATRRNSGTYVCTQSLSNSVDCSHTDIAVQTGGSTLIQQNKHFNIAAQAFEQTNLSANGQPQPLYQVDVTNTGTVAITSVSIQVSGLPWTVTWANYYPLLPGITDTATSTSVPLGLVLTIGSVYQVSFTATLADGNTETITTNAIYTLGAGLGL
ncbi:hypothetical protein E6H23_02390 [Candidatus Bathyarchaeota archaeon]|nr:MAG: hypothetical protein E6H23_02390 [Candidatus Bathyarchaeota archaeon]